MNVIRHDYISPKRDVKFRGRAMAILLMRKLSTMQRGKTFAVAGCKRDEVERLIDVN